MSALDSTLHVFLNISIFSLLRGSRLIILLAHEWRLFAP